MLNFITRNSVSRLQGVLSINDLSQSTNVCEAENLRLRLRNERVHTSY